jgi:hypothetical protein
MNEFFRPTKNKVILTIVQLILLGLIFYLISGGMVAVMGVLVPYTPLMAIVFVIALLTFNGTIFFAGGKTYNTPLELIKEYPKYEKPGQIHEGLGYKWEILG